MLQELATLVGSELQCLSMYVKRQASRNTSNQKKTGRSAGRKNLAQRLKPAPEKLDELLRLINLLPPDVELPGLPSTTVLDKLGEPGDAVRQPTRLAEINEAIERSLSRLPEVFRHYIRATPLRKRVTPGGESFALDQTVRAIDRYTNFDRMRTELRRLVRRAKHRSSLGDLRDAGRLVGLFLPVRCTAELTIRSGVVELTGDPLWDALDGIEDAMRIRECEICTRIFWAGRLDARCCSTRCAGIRRKRLYREKYYIDRELRESKREKSERTKIVGKKAQEKGK